MPASECSCYQHIFDSTTAHPAIDSLFSNKGTLRRLTICKVKPKSLHLVNKNNNQMRYLLIPAGQKIAGLCWEVRSDRRAGCPRPGKDPASHSRILQLDCHHRRFKTYSVGMQSCVYYRGSDWQACFSRLCNYSNLILSPDLSLSMFSLKLKPAHRLIRLKPGWQKESRWSTAQPFFCFSPFVTHKSGGSGSAKHHPALSLSPNQTNLCLLPLTPPHFSFIYSLFKFNKCAMFLSFLTFVSTHCDKSSQIEVLTCFTVPERYSADGPLSLFFK